MINDCLAAGVCVRLERVAGLLVWPLQLIEKQTKQLLLLLGIRLLLAVPEDSFTHEPQYSLRS